MSSRWRRGTLAAGDLLTALLLAASLGFALAKLRVETVRAPVLEKQTARAEVRGIRRAVEPRAAARRSG